MTDTPSFDLDICRMAEHCRTRTTGSDGTTIPGVANGRGLCWPCELHGRFAIQALPGDWRDLVLRSRKDAGRAGLSSLGGPQAEAPIPIRLDLDAAAREIAWYLDVWAAPVFERIPRAENGRGAEFVEHGVRTAWAVTRSAGLLDRFYSVLLALGPTDYYPYDSGEPATDDGPGAIVTLTSLHHRTRSILGDTRRSERRDLPCPPAPYGCGLDNVLVQPIGEAVVRCTWCGWSCTDAEYATYAITYVPPKLGRCPTCSVPAGEPHPWGCPVARCLVTGHPRHVCAATGPVPHDCGCDEWTGIWPGVSEAREYGVDLAVLLAEGRWDQVTCRWYLDAGQP